MAVIVGTDSYLSLADANTYLTNHYLSTDAKLVAWTAMTDADNDVLLRKALWIIERQPFIGYKATEVQTLAFPRTLYTEIRNDPINPLAYTQYNHWYQQIAVPAAVKDAQCEIAIELTDNTNTRMEMQRQGVKSFSVLGLSETYYGSANKLVSLVAQELLMPYMGGGFAVC